MPGRSEQLRGFGRHLPKGPLGMWRQFHQLGPPVLRMWLGLDPAGLPEFGKAGIDRRRRAEARRLHDIGDVERPLLSGALPDEVQNGPASQIDLMKPSAELRFTHGLSYAEDQIIRATRTL